MFNYIEKTNFVLGVKFLDDSYETLYYINNIKVIKHVVIF